MRPPILFSTAPERGQAFAARWAGLRPAFWCVLAHTDTCLIPGVSAAGISAELRPLTPAADAEVVHLVVVDADKDDAILPQKLTCKEKAWQHH